jgi:hypothetical protein
MDKKEFITSVLYRLEQPFTIIGNSIIITPTSSALLETLPGNWVSNSENTQLIIDFDAEIDFVEYIAQLIKLASSNI